MSKSKSESNSSNPHDGGWWRRRSRGDFRNSGDVRGGQQSFPSSNRPRQPKQTTHTDADGFTVIGVAGCPVSAPKSQTPETSSISHAACCGKEVFFRWCWSIESNEYSSPLSDEKLEKSIKACELTLCRTVAVWTNFYPCTKSGTPGAEC
jgi:hypothetical protein